MQMKNSRLRARRWFVLIAVALAAVTGGHFRDSFVSAQATGLVAAYSFDEGTGTTAGDVSGNANSGTLSGATWTTSGKYGNALSFNGTSARVTIADSASLDLTNAMTLEAWVRPSVTQWGWRSVVTKDVDQYYLMGSSNPQDRPAIGGTFGTTNQNVFATAGLPANTWTHLAASFDRTTIRLYVNGVQVATGPQTAAISTSNAALTIGANFYGEYFQGLIDEVRVYNRALTATEIQTDMATPLSTGGPSVSDLMVTKTHAGSFTQGQTGASYALTVSNSGTAATNGTVTVSDTLPTGLTATNASGTGWTCTTTPVSCTRSDALAAASSYPAITLTVNVASNAAASVTNTASVSGGGEVNTSNNTANDVTTINGVADLTISKTHTGNFTQGQTGATYTLTVSNTGTGATSGAVTVSDTLPTGLTATVVNGTGWTCTVTPVNCTRSNALAAGSSYPAITLTVNVASNAAASVTNTATVNGGGEVNTANNTSSDVTTINVPATPDLVVSKTHTGNFTQGQTGATYTLTVSNSGAGATSGVVTVSDVLPTGLTVAAATGIGWTCTVTPVSCTRSNALAAGGSYPAITLTVNVASNAPASLTNTATVSGGGEVNTSNNTASDVTTINGIADLTISKTHTGNFTQGQSGATYTLTASNAGTGATSGVVTVSDTLPTGLTATVLTGTGWTCTVTPVSCTRSNALAAGGSYPAITLTVNVAINAPASVTNTATVSGGGEVNSSNNTASDVTTIVAVPDLVLSKTHAGSFTQGQAGASYTLTVSNTGSGATSGVVTVSDTLPTGLTATAATGAGWACAVTPVSCTRSDALAASGSYPAITLTVNVAGNASSSVTNTATVSGGAEVNTSNDTASDVTTIATAPDTQAPTAPSGLGASPSGTQITLNWTAATDNVGVTGYRVERCQGASCTNFAEITSTSSLSYVDGGLTASTSYSYRVRATDAAGLLGPYSNVASATTGTIPSGLVGAYSFNEGTGTTAADGSGNANTGTLSGATWTTSGKYGNALSFNGTTARVTIADSSSLDLSNAMTLEAWVQPSVTLASWRSVVTKDVDRYYLMASSDPQNRPAIGGTFGSTNQNVLGTAALAANTWTHLAATYDRTTIRLYVNGVQVASAAQTAAISTSNAVLTIGANGYGEYFSGLIDEVRIYNRALTAGEIQTDMATPLGGGAGPDTTPPTAPSSLSATASSSSQIQLTWTASSDNVGVTSYAIERCQGAGCTGFTEITTVTAPQVTFSDAGLASGASYSYRVRARDAAQNQSQYSNTGSTITPAPDTEPPSAPGPLSATAISGTQVTVSWGAATDNIGVAGYRLERCEGADCSIFTKFDTTITGTTFTDSSLNVSTSYSYIVRAQDAAGNLGPYSNVATTTTLATNPNLVASYAFDEGAGTTLADVSGGGHNGTIVNATWAAVGKFGKALAFNGNNALVTIPDAPALRLTTGMTLEVWVNPTGSNTGWRDVVYKGDDNYYLEGSTSTGAPAIGIRVGSTHAEAFGLLPLPLNTWTFLAGTYDGTTLRFYVNGTQVSSQPQSGPLVTSTSPLQIGGDSLYGQFFTGLIDEVRIYSVALTPAQIQADMGAPIGASPAVGLSSSHLTFSSQAVGTSSAPQTVSVTDVGSQPLNITSVTVSGAQASEFTQTNNCVGTVQPAASCTVSVVFTPVAGGSRSAAVAIASNAPGSPHTISLSGAGDGFAVSPSTAVLTAGQTQQFVASGAGSSGAVWSVDGVVGGGPATGTVTPTGLYTAPASGGTHAVTATSSNGLYFATATTYITTNAGVFTHRNDNARTGQNLTETVLTLQNVNSTSFGKLASYAIDGIAHASPLYVANVNVPGYGIRNVVYVATEHNGFYAFDADGRNATPLWYRSFINPSAGITTVPDDDVQEFFDITPEIGITGTPVIDPASKTLYVVVKTKESATNYVQRLHAIDIETGAEKFGGPVVIQASVPGTGVGSSGGQLAFNALRENQRTALLLHNGVVYFGFGSHGDNQPYHGWLLGYNATTLQRVFVFNTTPNGEGGGIWQSGGGLVIDAGGNFYFATGDGTFTKNTGGVDYGNTFLKLSPSGVVLDYFTPKDQAFLDANNLDLDAGGMILLPDQAGAHPHVLVSAGKDGSVFMVDRDNMGQYQNPDRNVQTLTNIFPFGTPLPGNYSSPVYYNGKVYFAPVADVLQAFTLTNGLMSTSASSTTLQSYPYPGGAISISANGAANGILWAVRKNGQSPGTLHAYDASNLAFELYNSGQAGTRDALGDAAAKFSLPLVINGRVYVASEGKFTIYGLLP